MTVSPSAVNIAASVSHCCDELQGHQPIVHAGEGGAGKFDHVHLDALAGKAVQQRTDEALRLDVLVECGVNEVHADDADGFLLAETFPSRASAHG